MADEIDPEIIILSSDEESKPQMKRLNPPGSASTKVSMGPSKAQSKNRTVSKKQTYNMTTLKYLPSTTVVSNKNTSIGKQIVAERAIKVRTLPVNKNHSVIHNNVKFSRSTKPVTSPSHQFSKCSPKVHPATAVSQNFINRNYVSSSPRSNANANKAPVVVSRTNSISGSRIVRPPSVSLTQLSKNSNSIPNSENKTSISSTMLDCLKKKGISVVNVDDSKSNLNSKVPLVTSPQSYLNSIKNTLKKHNINIDVVPVSTDASRSTSTNTLSAGGIKETSNVGSIKGTSSISSIKVTPSIINTKTVSSNIKTSLLNNAGNSSLVNNARNSLLVNNARNSSHVNNARNSSIVNNARNSSLVINTRSTSHLKNAGKSSFVTNIRNSSDVSNTKYSSVSSTKNPSSSLSRTVVNSKSLSQTTLKRKFQHSDSVIQNKLVCTRKSDKSPQNVIYVKSGDASTMDGHKVNAIKNALHYPNSSHSTSANVAQYHKVSESQKSNSKIESASKINPKTKSSTSNTILPYSFKGSLTIIPVETSKITTSGREKPVKNSSQFSSQQKCLQASPTVKEGSNNNSVKTASSTAAPFLNPALSVTVVNSSKSLQPDIGSSKIAATIAEKALKNMSKHVKITVIESSKTMCVREKPVKHQSKPAKTSNKSSLPSSTKTKSLHTALLPENKKLTSAIPLQLPKKVSKSIDLSKDRDKLLSILSASVKTSNNETVKIPKNIQIRTVSENKAVSYDEPIKLIDVPNKIISWPKPVVLLHRIDIPTKYLMAKETFSTTGKGGFFVKESAKKVALQASGDIFVAEDKTEKSVDPLQTVSEFVMEEATDEMVTPEKVNSFAIKDTHILPSEVASQISQDEFVVEENKVEEEKLSDVDSPTHNLEEEPLQYTTASAKEANVSSSCFSKFSKSLEDTSASIEKNNCVSSHFENAVVNQLVDETSKMDHTDSAVTPIVEGNNSVLDINFIPKISKNNSSISVASHNNTDILPLDNLCEKLDGNQSDAKNSEVNYNDSSGEKEICGGIPNSHSNDYRNVEVVSKLFPNESADLDNNFVTESDSSKLISYTGLEKSVADLSVVSDDLVNCNLSIIKSLLVDIVSSVENKIAEKASVKDCTDFDVPRIISVNDENLSLTSIKYHDVQKSDFNNQKHVTEQKNATAESEHFCTDILVEQDSSNSSRSFECSTANQDLQINVDSSAESIPNFILQTQKRNLMEVECDSPLSDNFGNFLEQSERVDEPMEGIEIKTSGSSNDSIIITGVTSLAGTFDVSKGAFSSMSGVVCTNVVPQSNALVAASMDPQNYVHREDNLLTLEDAAVIVLSDDSWASDSERLSSHELIIQKCLFDILQKINVETIMMNRGSSPLNYSVLSPDLNDDLTTNSSVIEENSQNLSRLQNQVSTFFSKDNENKFGNECSKLSRNMFDNLLEIDNTRGMPEKSKEWQLKPFCLNDEQDLNAVGESCLTSSEDEGKSPSKQQVTSPKLSLKRSRHKAQLSPEREEHKITEDFHVNGKKIKLKQDVSSAADGPLQVPLSEVSARNENRKKFTKFLEYSKTLMDLDTSDFEKEKITQRMLQELENTQQWYPSSIIFSSLIDTCRKKLELDSSETFNVLVEMKKEMKKYKRRLKSSTKENSVQPSMSLKSGIFTFNFNDSTNSSSQLPSDNPSIPEEKHHHYSSKSNNVEEQTDFLSNFSLFSNHSPKKNNNKTRVRSSIVSPKETITKTSASAVRLDSELRRNSVNDPIESEPPSPAPSTSKMCCPVIDVKRNSAKRSPVPAAVASSSKQASDDSSSENRPSTAVQDHRNKERIRKLEKMLRDLDKAIKKLQNKELSLDDLDNPTSCYIKEDQYKRRFVKIYKKLCQLQKVPARTGRIVEKKFTYEGSRYKVINSAIQNLINKKKSHEKFPDFSEVLNVIKLVNQNDDVGLTEKSIFVEAERVFKDIGMELQIRRCRDEEELFGCYLTDNFNPAEDPAEHDERLRSTLVENNQKFEASITELINSYAEIQNAGGDDREDNEEGGEDNKKEEDDRDKEKSDNEMDSEDNLPATQPSSPALIEKGNRGCSNGEDVIEILDSDRSTDPNEVTEEKRAVVSRSGGSVIIADSLVIEAANSDDDLPPLHELIGS